MSPSPEFTFCLGSAVWAEVKYPVQAALALLAVIVYAAGGVYQWLLDRKQRTDPTTCSSAPPRWVSFSVPFFLLLFVSGLAQGARVVPDYIKISVDARLADGQTVQADGGEFRLGVDASWRPAHRVAGRYEMILERTAYLAADSLYVRFRRYSGQVPLEPGCDSPVFPTVTVER